MATSKPAPDPRPWFMNPTRYKDTSSKETSSKASSSKDTNSNDTRSSAEFWNKHRAASKTPTKSQPKIPQPEFELNMPEHLPSSPLCPRNPKHKSGGTGVCAYHGRRRSAKTRMVGTNAGDGAGKSGSGRSSGQATGKTARYGKYSRIPS